jgi:hypothetical protein
MASLYKLRLVGTNIEVAKKVMDLALRSSRQILSLSINLSGSPITLLKHGLMQRVVNLELSTSENIPFLLRGSSF